MERDLEEISVVRSTSESGVASKALRVSMRGFQVLTLKLTIGVASKK